MLQDVRLQCISEVLKVITREFGIDSLFHDAFHHSFLMLPLFIVTQVP